MFTANFFAEKIDFFGKLINSVNWLHIHPFSTKNGKQFGSDVNATLRVLSSFFLPVTLMDRWIHKINKRNINYYSSSIIQHRTVEFIDDGNRNCFIEVIPSLSKHTLPFFFHLIVILKKLGRHYFNSIHFPFITPF